MVLRSNKGSQSTMALSCSQAKTWVKTHYERNVDGVVAKSVMYKHYEDFCREQSRNIMETSIFGRVVKSVFPDVTIRRLGGRDNLKYYYCGIRAKETSPYAIDNTTTTRPKRRLRKRELVTDKTEVHNCLRWLHAHFSASSETSVVKTEVYEAYVSYCVTRGVDPLSAQYFGMVVTHAFPNVTKRKLGPRTNQQKYYFGIQERLNPMSLEMVPSDILSSVEEVLKTESKDSYREVENEDEEEDYQCRSPDSDMSDLVSHNFHHYHIENFHKEETEPVDYSFSTLKLKDEINDEDDIIIKEEPLERRTPDRPLSAGNFVSSSLPSPPSKDVRSRKIYKPRFHYENSWNEEPTEEKLEESSVHFYEESQAALILNKWIFCNLEDSKGVHINRDQLFMFYEKYCAAHSVTNLPLTYFDETILKVFQGVVTMIHPSSRTFYDGIRFKGDSPLLGKIQELFQEELPWTEDESSQHPMELSLEDASPTHSSPLTLEDEDDNPDEGYSFQDHQIGDDLQSASQIPRDGKYYLRQWLTDNFEPVNDSCVLKADAYRQYDIFSKNINQIPFEMNVFGKIVRQVFPKVSIRRLGGRMKPQYHYCGIAVKSTSPLCLVMSGKDPAQRSRKKEIATDNHSAEVVIDFLRCNYEAGKERSIMKSEVFDKYSAFCSAIKENPITLNYFGKLVKYCFPHVEARKYGGRSEPTWYYFGMYPKEGISYGRYQQSLPQMSLSPSFHDDPTMKETMGAPFSDSIRLSPAIMEVSFHHPASTPIAILGDRKVSNTTVHYAASPPSLINAHLIHASSRVYDEPPNQRGSPIDIYFSRSPVESLHQGQLYVPSQAEFSSRDTFHHAQRLFLAGGQVVPSQTPPNMLVSHSSDHSMGLQVVGKKPKRLYPSHEEFEILQDIGME